MAQKIVYDWDFSPLIKDENEVSAKLKEIEKAYEGFAKKWKQREDYLESSEVLESALKDYEHLQRHFGDGGNPYLYYYLKFYQNQNSSEIKSGFNKVEEFEKKMRNLIRFFTLNLAKVKKEKQTVFLKDSRLKNYKHFLEIIFANSPHLLSESEEKIMSLKETPSHDLWERLTSSLLTKQEKEIQIDNKKQVKNFSELLSLIDSKNKTKRDNAAKAINEILLRYAEVAEQEINAILANKKINDELRSFPRPDSARHLQDDISTETVDTLIKSVSSRFDLSHRFYKLKAKLLGLEKIKYYERAVPYGEDKTEYKFEDSIELVDKTFSNLDSEFSKIFRKFLEKGQIDVFPKKGKQNGAFCMHLLPTQPVFVLLNHTNSLKDVTIIAHEMGHAINAVLMNRTQNALNIGTPKSTAEVASTFMEDFVLDELLKEADDEKKLVILMEKLNGDISSIFRQTAFYNFETELHKEFRKKGYLSGKEIGEIFVKHMASYMGDCVDVSEANNWWIYVPHFRYIFYVYSYASGLLISKTLQAEHAKDKKFIGKMKEFLSAGTSDSPENLFRNLGFDITKKEFWEEGLGKVDSLLKEAENLAEKLRKL